MKILKDLEVLSIPTTTKFRGISEREVVIFQGPAGWSEFSPFVEYDDFEAKNWLKAAIEGANRNWQNLKKEKIIQTLELEKNKSKTEQYHRLVTKILNIKY